jgi:hypothetical protein
MANELCSYSDTRFLRGLEIGKTGDLFRRYSFIEQACVRALAGWFLKIIRSRNRAEQSKHDAL